MFALFSVLTIYTKTLLKATHQCRDFLKFLQKSIVREDAPALLAGAGVGEGEAPEAADAGVHVIDEVEAGLLQLAEDMINGEDVNAGAGEDACHGADAGGDGQVTPVADGPGEVLSD